MNPSHSQNCPCVGCMARCDRMAADGLIPLNAEWWKTQSIFPVQDSPAAPAAIALPRTMRAQAAECVACKGTGVKFVKRPCALYGCGYYKAVIGCRVCFGFGRIVHAPSPTPDFKAVASGDVL